MPINDELGKLFIDIETRQESLGRQLKKLDTNLEKRAGVMSKKFGNAFKKGLAGFIGFAGIFQALSITTQAKNLARDAEEIRTKFNTVFSSIEKGIEASFLSMY